MRRRELLGGALALSLTGALPALAHHKPGHKPKLTPPALPPTDPPLTFFDDFSGPLSLDEAGDGNARWLTWWHRWGVRHLAGNGDQCLKASPNYRGTGGASLAELSLATHEVCGQHLHLYGRPIPDAYRGQFHGFPYVGGMVSTERSHWQAKGSWECRARFEASTGHHWAMWLLPQDGSWPPEIDMVEVVGGDGWFYHAAHGTSHPGGWKFWTPDDYQGWHTHTFQWNADWMLWFVDGVERTKVPTYFTKPMYFLITPEIGGNWPGSPDSSTIWPMRAVIDYVRISA